MGRSKNFVKRLPIVAKVVYPMNDKCLIYEYNNEGEMRFSKVRLQV